MATVFTLYYPGWAGVMVLRSVDEVLANLKVELQEMEAERSVRPGDIQSEFFIGIEERTQEELDSLPEWTG